MKAPRARRYWQALLLLAGGALPAAFAYNIDGHRWVNGSSTFYVGMPGTSPSGISWSTAFANAMQKWSDTTSFKYIAEPGYVNPCAGYSQSTGNFPSGNGDAKNGADFRANVCGNSFGSGVLAITLSTSLGGQLGFSYLHETDIIFNDSYHWDVYDGSRRTNIIDFGRVALHELGHALGLDHETTITDSIMAPRISDLYQLRADDIAGAQAIYGPKTLCSITTLPLNGVVKNSLGLPDCRVKDLFGGGTDDSFVDVYRITLGSPSHILADMRSSQLDSTLVLTDSKLNLLDIFEGGYQGTCNAHMDKTLAAGEYLLLANTYVKPIKCASNQGSYSLSITDNRQPVLGETVAIKSGTPAATTLITGGASADGGLTYQTSFSNQDSINVNASILLDPSQVGQNGKIYILAQVSNGSQYVENSSGQFVPFNGDLSQMPSYKSGPLAALEQINVVQNLRGAGTPLAGLNFVVYVGYALDSAPANIQYGSEPIRFGLLH